VIPLKDLEPRRSVPVITLLLILANVAVFLYQISLPARAGNAFVDHYAVVPAKISLALAGHHYSLADALTPLLTSMFLHAGWLHILGNMWFLWIFGRSLEDRMGRSRYLLFYLVCGVVAAVAQVVATPYSMAPMIGASGAIAGVLGGYILLYPTARVRCLWILFVFITTVRIPAWILLGVWFLSQFLTPLESGVAWVAHVGGFLGGLMLVNVFVKAPERVVRQPAYAMWDGQGDGRRGEWD
jgi:membrane associated rhomboid family serine protease